MIVLEHGNTFTLECPAFLHCLMHSCFCADTSEANNKWPLWQSGRWEHDSPWCSQPCHLLSVSKMAKWPFLQALCALWHCWTFLYTVHKLPFCTLTVSALLVKLALSHGVMQMECQCRTAKEVVVKCFVPHLHNGLADPLGEGDSAGHIRGPWALIQVCF